MLAMCMQFDKQTRCWTAFLFIFPYMHWVK